MSEAQALRRTDRRRDRATTGVITGTLPVVCYADGMTRYLNAKKGPASLTTPSSPMRERVRETAVALVSEAGVSIEHVAKPHIRKEDIVAACWRVAQYRPHRGALPTRDLLAGWDGAFVQQARDSADAHTYTNVLVIGF